MSVRLLLTDEVWNKLSLVLDEIKRKDGRRPVISDRQFIEAVLYIARTGIPFRDLPDEFGNWSAIYNRLRRWTKNGTWEKLWQRLQQDKLKLSENLFIDSTCEGSSIPLHRPIRAHQHAAGAPEKNVCLDFYLEVKIKTNIVDNRLKLSGEVAADFQRKFTSVVFLRPMQSQLL